MKLFCIDRQFVESEGLKCVVHNVPVVMVACAPVAAKSFKWKSVEEFRAEEFIQDTKAMDGALEIMEIDISSINNLISMFPNEDEKSTIVYTNNIDEADALIARIFVNDTSYLHQPVPMPPADKLEYNNKKDD